MGAERDRLCALGAVPGVRRERAAVAAFGEGVAADEGAEAAELMAQKILRDGGRRLRSGYALPASPAPVTVSP